MCPVLWRNHPLSDMHRHTTTQNCISFSKTYTCAYVHFKSVRLSHFSSARLHSWSLRNKLIFQYWSLDLNWPSLCSSIAIKVLSWLNFKLRIAWILNLDDLKHNWFQSKDSERYYGENEPSAMYRKRWLSFLVVLANKLQVIFLNTRL